MRHRAMAHEPFSARIAAVEALPGASEPQKANAVPLRGAADELDAAAPLYEHSATAVGYTALAELLRICAQLWNGARRYWALLRKPTGSSAPRGSATKSGRLSLRESWRRKRSSLRAAPCSNIASVQDVGRLLDAVSMVPIPVGVFREERRMRVPNRDSMTFHRSMPMKPISHHLNSPWLS